MNIKEPRSIRHVPAARAGRTVCKTSPHGEPFNTVLKQHIGPQVLMTHSNRIMRKFELPAATCLLLLCTFFFFGISFMLVNATRPFVLEDLTTLSRSLPIIVNSDRSDARNIYLDLGANWGQTLDLFPDICRSARRSICDQQYDVFSFEASPYISPFVEQLTRALNQGTAKPNPPFPSSGSSIDLKRINKEIGSPCPLETNALRKCFLDKYRDTLGTLQIDPKLNSSFLISSRLDSAGHGHGFRREKYTFIPAAVSDENSWLEIRQSFLGLLIGGTTTSGNAPNFSSLGDEYLPTVHVRTVNLNEWLEVNFKQEDTIIVKMDIEGAEHDVIKNMIKIGTHKLIDVLAWECHTKGGDCNFLRKALQQFTNIEVLEEGKDYNGWKSETV